MMARALLAASAVLAAAALSACSEPTDAPAYLRVPGGEPERGRGLIQAYGCGTCHTIQSVRGARGSVGPPLENFAERNLLAGTVPNVPRNLVAWLVDPPAIRPQTGMPAVGLSEPEARHIAAYLYTLGTSRATAYPSGPPLAIGNQDVSDPARGEVVPGRR